MVRLQAIASSLAKHILSQLEFCLLCAVEMFVSSVKVRLFKLVMFTLLSLQLRGACIFSWLLESAAFQGMVSLVASHLFVRLS